MYFHVLIYRNVQSEWRIAEWPIAFVDLAEKLLQSDFITPFLSGIAIRYHDLEIRPEEVRELVVTKSLLPSSEPLHKKAFDTEGHGFGTYAYGVGYMPFETWFALHCMEVTEYYLPKAKLPQRNLQNPVNTPSKSAKPRNVEKPPHDIHVFLCHASLDKPAVRSLFNRLKNEPGIVPWLDEDSLLPGQDWKIEITKAVRASHVVLICLSNKSISKSGFVQKEIREAIDVADEQPEGTIFIIPVKLEECEVPHSLRRWQWVNLFDKDGYSQLKKGLFFRADSVR